MGILNITPDSFFDGGKYLRIDDALHHVERMLNEGADIVDIGAYSSRPGAADISLQEELNRLIPIIARISTAFPEATLSIDTFRSVVAKEAINSGGHIVNDISGGNLDEEMFSTVAKLGVPYILMHSRGNPNTMQRETVYNNLIDDIILDFSKKIKLLHAYGVKDVILDPGFGFAKTLHQNYELLNGIERLKILGMPILGALSRKSMIYNLLEISSADALNGTTVLNTLLLTKGIQIIRVHDVKEAVQVRKLVNEVNSYN
ncbi:dihydropteroate synthase [Olivibacter sp. SDN3]|uniref:dihydropteroate synthase n=1 Tax=Olivibacter sp. SDN3 TaxID=2764720 RepID=UPI002107FBE9|nr:dihydropteroate synthase [Olivibacter sp. SDN3]